MIIKQHSQWKLLVELRGHDQQGAHWASLLVNAACIALAHVSALLHTSPHMYIIHSTVFWSTLQAGVVLMCAKLSTWAHLEQGACDVSGIWDYTLLTSLSRAGVWQLLAWTDSPVIGNAKLATCDVASCMLLVAVCPSYVNRPYSQWREYACSLVCSRQFPWENRALLVLVVKHFESKNIGALAKQDKQWSDLNHWVCFPPFIMVAC